MYAMGADIPTSLGTRAASADLSPPPFPIPKTHFCFFALLPHSDWASLEQRLFSGACRQRTRLPTQLTAGDTQTRLGFLSHQPLSRHPRFTAAHSRAAHRLPESPSRMRHMEQTRRVAGDNLVPDVLLSASPCTGSACACCRA
jgi:hypothetical protein